MVLDTSRVVFTRFAVHLNMLSLLNVSDSTAFFATAKDLLASEDDYDGHVVIR